MLRSVGSSLSVTEVRLSHTPPNPLTPSADPNLGARTGDMQGVQELAGIGADLYIAVPHGVHVGTVAA